MRTTTMASLVDTWAGDDLSVVAARLTRADRDGHLWDEEDVRQWLRRMRLDPAQGGGGRAGGDPNGPRRREPLRPAG